uniref:Uncharacterized protein n=1 Tax=Chrysemys picta bellii TaxID=8478 RepID=A0A8C3I2L8_CHRPI
GAVGALNRLPDELLALILSWVPGRALVTRCRLVCRRWRDLIDGPTVWRLQAAARLCPSPQWSRIGLLEPFGRNLVRNPCGQGGCRTGRGRLWEGVRKGG